MKKIYSFLAVFFMCCQFSVAFAGQDAETVLNNVQKHYKTIKTIEAKFLQISRSEALNEEEKSEGNFVALIPDNIKIAYNKPRNQVYVVTKEGLTFLNHEDKQVLKDKVDVAVKSKLPLTFLAGIGDLRKDFDIDEMKESDANFEISLSPKNDSEIETLVLWVKKDTLLINKIFVQELGDNTISFELSNINLNKNVSINDFKFQIPKGYDLINNRE